MAVKKTMAKWLGKKSIKVLIAAAGGLLPFGLILLLGSVFVLVLGAGSAYGNSSAGGGSGGIINEQYGDLVAVYAQEYGVPSALVLAVMKAESGFNPTAVSPVGAAGLMQMMPSTFEWMQKSYFPEDNYTSADLFTPEVSIKYGTKYLSTLTKKYEPELESAIAAYNAGSGNVDKWLKNPAYSSGGKLHTIPFSETRAYVKIVMGYYEDYQNQATAPGNPGSGSLNDNLNPIDGKTNLGLVQFAHNALNAKSGYIYGAYGQTVTMEFLQQQAKQFAGNTAANLTPSEVEKIYFKFGGHPSFDCIGLIKAYWWLNESTGKIKYGANGAADMNATGAYRAAVKKGPIKTMPEIPGLAVWQPGHIGVYIGNGYVIEAQGNSTGVVKTKVSKGRWTHWLQLPYLEYQTS